MEGHVAECSAERECACGGSLGVLRDVQRAYEARLASVCRAGGADKLQKQVQLLQSWVSDLVGQNALLARTVEDLEGEVTSRLLLERRRHAERDKSKKSCDKLMECNENLQKEIIAKDKEIRRLNKDVQHYEQTIVSLRKDMSSSQYHTPDVSKVDAEVTADICCSGMQIGDITPVKDYSTLLRNEYQERLQQMENSLKCSSESVRTLRESNVSLSKELHSLRQLCAALGEQCRAFAVRADFRDELVREMRRQLRHAKAKLKEASEASGAKVSRDPSIHEMSRDSLSSASTLLCVRQQPRRAPHWPCASGDEATRAE